jgi:hypothetical protein
VKPYDLALQRSYKDFRETHPGVKYDKSNIEHERFMDRQIRAHMHLMERNRLQKEFGGQWSK